ncbi:hypothetical protein Trydic_g7296 [Trypoxylus dichotomus]
MSSGTLTPNPDQPEQPIQPFHFPKSITFKQSPSTYGTVGTVEFSPNPQLCETSQIKCENVTSGKQFQRYLSRTANRLKGQGPKYRKIFVRLIFSPSRKCD